MDTIKKYWKAIAGAVGAILGYIFLRQYFQKDLLAKLLNRDVKAKDDLLSQVNAQLRDDAALETERNKEIRKELSKDAPKADPNEIEDFYKKKLK